MAKFNPCAGVTLHQQSELRNIMNRSTVRSKEGDISPRYAPLTTSFQNKKNDDNIKITAPFSNTNDEVVFLCAPRISSSRLAIFDIRKTIIGSTMPHPRVVVAGDVSSDNQEKAPLFSWRSRVSFRETRDFTHIGNRITQAILDGDGMNCSRLS